MSIIDVRRMIRARGGLRQVAQLLPDPDDRQIVYDMQEKLNKAARNELEDSIARMGVEDVIRNAGYISRCRID